MAVSAKARMAFSMGRYIVLPENLAQSEDLPMVLRHEMAHIRLRHSWDLLMADLAGCLQWFNPFCHLLRRELQAVHEFEADREVLGKGVDAEAYSMLLIRVSSGREILPKQVWGGNMAVCSNALNYNQLKNRLKMMTRQESKRGAKAKALCFLPVLAVGLLLFGQKEYVYARVSPLPESGDVRTETITALQEAVSPARALASDTSLEEKIQQVQSISASIADDLFKISLEVSEEVEAGIREVLDALDSRMEFEINGKTVGLSELVKGVQDGLYDEKQLEITAFRIKDEDDSSRLEVSFDGQVMVWDENGGGYFDIDYDKQTGFGCFAHDFIQLGVGSERRWRGRCEDLCGRKGSEPGGFQEDVSRPIRLHCREQGRWDKVFVCDHGRQAGFRGLDDGFIQFGVGSIRRWRR